MIVPILSYSSVPQTFIFEKVERTIRISVPWTWAWRAHLFYCATILLPIVVVGWAITFGVLILIFGIEKELVVYVTIIFIPEYLISAVIQWYLSRLTATRILEYEAGLFRSMRVSGKIIKEWKAPSFPRIRAIRIPFSSYGVIVLNRGFLGLWMSPAVPHKELADAIAILIETMDADK